jgi:hypothetical protein
MLIRNFADTIMNAAPSIGCFAEDDSGDAGDDGAANQGGATPPPSGSNGGSTPPPGDPNVIRMTKDEFGGRLGKKYDKGKADGQAELLAELNISSSDELQEMVQQREQSMSEVDRLKRENKKLMTDNQKAMDGLSTANQQINSRTRDDSINAALELEANPQKDTDGNRPEGRQVFKRSQVRQLIGDQIDVFDGKAVVVKDGEPDYGTDVGDFIKGFLDDNPNLVRSQVRGGSGSSPTPGAPPPRHEFDSNNRQDRVRRLQQMIEGGK